MSVILDAHIIMFLNVRGKLHHLKDLKDAACIKVEFYLIHSADWLLLHIWYGQLLHC